MPKTNNSTEITEADRASFIAMQVYPRTRDTLKKVAKERRIPICILIEELADDAYKKSFPDESD